MNGTGDDCGSVESMSEAWGRLKARLEELRDLGSAQKLFEWDQAVLMPEKGGRARAKAAATLEGISHDRLTDPEVGALLDELGADDSLPDDQKAHVRVTRREYDRATKVPADLVREIAELQGVSYQTWTEARPKNDFKMMEPFLERLVELKKQEADAIGWQGERYDALIDVFEPDMTTAEVEKMFADLVTGLTPLANSILDNAGDKPEWLNAAYPEDKQMAFSHWLCEQIAFDTKGGRLDQSPHPFTIQIGVGDVRQTTRTEPNTVMDSIFSTLHETGHALYEQGIPEELNGLPAGSVASLGLHESQSRMWENQVGRSRPFTEFMLPRLKDLFPENLGSISFEEFHRGANYPERSLIRVSADEVTYNLHVALRFELELAMFRGDLAVADLPGAWNDQMESFLGIKPTTDSDGVLQDMHWPIGALGYFPTYTLGTLYSAAFFDKAHAELGGLEDDLRKGDGSRLLTWLNDNVFRHAYLREPKGIAEDIIGGPITAGPFIEYLRTKYSAIYGMQF